MIIRNSAISEGYTPINIMVGKFQPLHNGHIKCMQEIYENTGVKTVILITRTEANRVNWQKPFSSQNLTHMYANIIQTGEYPFIEGFSIIDNADIVKNTKDLKEMGYLPVSWVCGSDRFSQYKKMFEAYKKDAWVSEDFKVFSIERTPCNNLSSSLVRTYIQKGLYKEFIKNTPFSSLPDRMSQRYFYTLQRYIHELNK